VNNQTGCFVIAAILAAAAGATVVLGIVAGNPFASSQPASVSTQIPQRATPATIVTATPTPSPTPSPTPPPSAGGVSAGGTVGPTPASVRGATGPLPIRACTGNWHASLRRSEETMLSNGYTQADVIFDVPPPGTPVFSLIGEPTIEAEQFLTAQPDPVTANEWDLFIDRQGDGPFPVGTHQLTLQIRVVDEQCEIPLTLIVE
jgi:hypothetical protein